MKKSEEDKKKWAQIVVKAWTDEAFKKKLLAHPKQVLQEHGISVGPNITCKITEKHRNEMHFSLPPKPEGNLSEADLKAIAAAAKSEGSACQGSTCSF